jgi:polyisoprenoid-binding protein YceI
MATTTPAVDLPSGTWDVDPSHTEVQFSARHLMVAKVRGRFGGVRGEIHVGDDPVRSTVRASVDVVSVDTGDAGRDEHLRSADFFDVEHHPTIEFASTGVRELGRGRFALDGDLTIRGVTRPVTLDLQYHGSARDPWGNTKAAFSASAEVNRKDWGLEWNVALDTGGVLVGDKVRIELDVEAALRS